MKKILTITIALLAVSAQALIVTIDDVVLAYHNDLTRFDYTGRAGEIVRNSQNQGLTIFDGVSTGGFSLVRPMDFIVTSPKDGNDDQGLMGERLKAVVALANAASTNRNANYNNYPVRVLVDTGIYYITNGLDVAYNVEICARITEEGIGQALSTRYTYEEARNRPAPTVTLTAIETNSIIRYAGIEGAINKGATLKGLTLVGDVEFPAITDNPRAYFASCIFNGGVASNTVIGAGTYLFITAKDCLFNREIFSDGPYDNFFMEAFDCHFSSNSTIHSLRLNSTFNDPYYDTEWRNCVIENPDFFQSGREGFTTVIPRLVDCKIAGNNFLASAVADYTFSGGFYNCRFINTGGTWGGSMTAGNGTTTFGTDQLKFFGCDGVESSFVSGTMSVQWCSDEDGVAIANQ